MSCSADRGRLEIRPASDLTATYRAGDYEAGWIVSLTFSVKNATDVPLVIDTASVRGLLEAPQTEAWTAQECGHGMERLDPLDRALRMLAPGEIVEQRFAWWAPRSRFDDNRCLFEIPTRVQLRLPGEPAIWLPVRP